MEARLRALSGRLTAGAERGRQPEGLPLRLQPDQESVVRVLELTRNVLFPAHFGQSKPVRGFAVAYEHGAQLAEIYMALAGQITLALLHHPDFREELIAAAEMQKIWRRSNRR